MLWYSYFRVIKLPLFTLVNKDHFYNFRYMTQFVIITLYFMGIVWSYKLIKKNIKNFNVLKKLYNGSVESYKNNNDCK